MHNIVIVPFVAVTFAMNETLNGSLFTDGPPDIYKVLFEQMDGGLIESKIESTILDAVSNWLPYLSIDEIIFDYDNNDIDNNRINLELKFSLVSNPNLGESVTINVNNN